MLFLSCPILLDVIVNFLPQEWVPNPYRGAITVVLIEIFLVIVLIAWLVPKLPKIKERKKMIPIVLMCIGALMLMVGSYLQYLEKDNSEMSVGHSEETKAPQEKESIKNSGFMIYTQGQSGGNNTIIIGRNERGLTDSERQQIDAFINVYRSVKIEVRVATDSDASRRLGKEVVEYIQSKGANAYIDSTSTYAGGSLGNGITFFENAPIIRVGYIE